MPIPNNPDDLLLELDTPEKAARIFADPVARKDWLGGYVKAFNDANRDTQTDWLRAETEKAAADFLTKNGYVPGGGQPKRPAMSDDAHGEGIYRGLDLSREQRRQIAATGKGPGVELVGQFADPFEFFKALDWQTLQTQGRDSRLKALGSGAGADGGFLIAEDYRAEVMKIALESAIVRPRARVIPMGGPTVRYPTIRDTTHASNWYGGITANWVAEGGDLSTVVQPTFGQVSLTAKKLTAYTEAPNELLADAAVALESLLLQLFPEAIAQFEDDSFLNSGVGAAAPVSVLNADALISVAKETAQDADTIVWENIVKMYSRMLPASLGRAVWVANIDTFPQLAQMSLAVGTGGAPVWLNSGVGGPPNSILGRPLIFTEKAETVGDAGDLMLVDFGYYLIGDRQAMTVDSSPHVRFTTDKTVWRFIQRVDGRPWIDSALTPRYSTATLSPFVSLAARA